MQSPRRSERACAAHRDHSRSQLDPPRQPEYRARAREVAIFDILEGNSFSRKATTAGPYKLTLAIVEDRLSFAISEEGTDAFTFVLSLSPLRRVMKDYFLVCESYHDAIRTATPSRIQSIDMGRRALHNEGSQVLIERLKGKVTIDNDTARRLFTLICALHWKG